jgi:hypothetical protein
MNKIEERNRLHFALLNEQFSDRARIAELEAEVARFRTSYVEANDALGEAEAEVARLTRLLEKAWLIRNRAQVALDSLLPEDMRAYVAAIETNADPAGMVRENVVARDALRAMQAEVARLRAFAEKVPTSWLDPLLTGPTAIIGKPPYNCRDIEKLLRAIAARLGGRCGAPEVK